MIEPDGGRYTVDSPVPYRMDDLVALADSRMGKLENRAVAAQLPAAHHAHQHGAQESALRLHLRRASRRRRLDGRHPVPAAAARRRRPADDDRAARRLSGRGVRRHRLGAVPPRLRVRAVERRRACRCSWSARRRTSTPTPTARIGFQPAREALSRIAKEGRKYGVFLGLVTQRPAQIDATLVSQCSTVFAMRMGNEADQKIVRAAVSDPGDRLLGFLAGARHRRGAGVRRRRPGGDPAALQGIARGVHSAQRGGLGRARRCRSQRPIATWSPRWWRAGAASPSNKPKPESSGAPAA